MKKRESKISKHCPFKRYLSYPLTVSIVLAILDAVVLRLEPVQEGGCVVGGVAGRQQDQLRCAPVLGDRQTPSYRRQRVKKLFQHPEHSNNANAHYYGGSVI